MVNFVPISPERKQEEIDLKIKEQVSKDLRHLNKTSFNVSTVESILKNSVVILKLGIVVKFDIVEQTGKVKIPSYGHLVINTRNISNFHLELKPHDLVILLQSSINIFDELDNIAFDKNHFYILAHLNPKKLTIQSDDQLKLQSMTGKIDMRAMTNLDILGEDIEITGIQSLVMQSTHGGVTIKSEGGTIEITTNQVSLSDIFDTIFQAIFNLNFACSGVASPELVELKTKAMLMFGLHLPIKGLPKFDEEKLKEWKKEAEKEGGGYKP